MFDRDHHCSIAPPRKARTRTARRICAPTRTRCSLHSTRTNPTLSPVLQAASCCTAVHDRRPRWSRNGPTIRWEEIGTVTAASAAPIALGFESPVVVWFLGASGIVSRKQLHAIRAYVYFALLLVALSGRAGTQARTHPWNESS